MVRRRTGISSLGFPSFNVGGQGGIIPTLSLPSVSPQFPRPRGRPSAPPSINPLAAIAPMIVPYISSAIGDAIDGPADTIDPSIFETEEFSNLPTYSQAKLKADYLYGTDTAQSAVSKGVETAINLLPLVGLEDPREISSYTTGLTNIQNQKFQKDKQTDFAKANYIAANSSVKSQGFDNYLDVEAAKNGVADYRPGYFETNPNTNRTRLMILDDDNKRYVDATTMDDGKGRNYIKARANATNSYFNELNSSDPLFKSFNEDLKNAKDRDIALNSTITVTNEVVSNLVDAEEDPSKNPLGFFGAVNNAANSILAQTNSALSAIYGDNRIFANNEDVNRGTAGSNGREGSGQIAKLLYEATLSNDPDALQRAIEEFDKSDAAKQYGVSIRNDYLGDLAFRNIRTSAALLQLAYMAAAANGQTGRTLSDKDLAYHLRMVGYGATQDPTALKKNLIGFVDQVIQQNDAQTEVPFGLNTIFSIYQDKLITKKPNDSGNNYVNAFDYFYDIKTDPNGVKDYTNKENYKFKSYVQRYGNVPSVTQFLNYERPKSPDIPNTIDEGKTGGIEGFDPTNIIIETDLLP